MADGRSTAGASGVILHAAALYDLTVWLMTLGRERAVRQKTLSLARLERGESVLDVGCGTGTLAIAAKRLVGPTGTVCGIDPSPEMIARAEKKARRAGVDVAFQNAAAEALPFSEAKFDAILSTVMLHHLSRKGRERCAAEMRRVVKPGGRVLVVEFGSTARDGKGVLARLHRHGRVELRDVVALLSEAGLDRIDSGAVGIGDMHFVLAIAPGRA